MSRNTLRTAVLAVALTLVVLVLGGLVFMYSGAYNVAATQDHTAVVRWVLETTMENSVAERAGEVPEPPAADSAMLEHGFEHFRSMCVMCHGAPGIDRGELGMGMTPTPPDLSEEAEERSPRELFWITKHGIKLAGMPAFGPTHSDEEIWGIVAFVERLPDMSPEEYAQLERRHAGAGPASGAAPASGAGDGHSDPPGSPSHSH